MVNCDAQSAKTKKQGTYGIKPTDAESHRDNGGADIEEGGVAHLAIAATAQHHGLTILTRNLKHFTPLGVDAHDPFAGLPES
jgi:predicted nucleic acid-binding protein